MLFTAALTAQADVPIPGLIGYWNANGTAADSSPVQNDGVFSGSYAPGRPGAGQSFDLGTAKVVIPDNAAYNLQSYASWTVGFWFNTEGTALGGGNGVFLGQDESAGEFPKWFIDYGYGHSGQFEIHLNNFGSNPKEFLPSDSVPIPPGWNQFTLVRNPGEFDFYLNGDPIGSQPYGGIIPDPSAPLVFGQQEALGYNNLLDDVVIYNRGLSPSEVAQLAEANSVPDSGGTFGALAASLMALMVGSRRIKGTARI